MGDNKDKLILDKKSIMLLNKLLENLPEKDRESMFNFIVVLGLTVINESMDKVIGHGLSTLKIDDLAKS